ncbi:MAG TPA: TIGR03067 domain-containing protein [Gemmatales bacterium]|nr:TIGR03067 domain-containing protein [Gemmatales bacterium]
MYRKLVCVLAMFLCSIPLAARDTSRLSHRIKQYEEKFAWRKAEQLNLQKLTDQELQTRFSAAKIDYSSEVALHEKKVSAEMLLTELIRRGGKDFEKVIVEKLETQRKDVSRDKDLTQNLPMLTALRRIQKKPDPMEIQVKQLGTVSTTRELPCFSVVLKNVDGEKQPFHFSFGGSYRSGRFARCTFEVSDAKGTKLPPRHWESMMGGGMFEMGNLEYGKTWDTELPMGSYVKILEPGEYTVRVLYHNTESIADFADLTGVIVCASEPFKVTVGKPIPRKVLIQAGSNEKVASLIRSLKGKNTVRTVCSKYDKDLYSFIDPTSAEGQLLLMEWSAVPGLLELLKDKNLGTEQRSWIFTMLYTLTHADDMRPFVGNVTSRFSHTDGVIGSYTYKGVGCFASGGGIINPELQQKFAEEWLKLAPELWEFVVADDVTLKDWAHLEGNWKMVSGLENGMEIKVDARSQTSNGVNIVYHYIKDREESIFGKNLLHQKAMYLIDGSKKTIDYDITQGVHQGRKQLGIYKTEGDTLTLCFSAPGKGRPDDFTSKSGSERTLTVWNRWK